jgi:hypothetical protein
MADLDFPASPSPGQTYATDVAVYYWDDDKGVWKQSVTTGWANTTEVNTGTITQKGITPDAFAGSVFGTKTVEMTIFDYTQSVSSGDGAGYFHVPASMNGMDLVDVHAEHITAANTNDTEIQIHNVTQAVDMLDPNFKLKIDASETGSDTSANSAVINTSSDSITTNDLLRIDIDAVQSTAGAPKGLILTMEYRLP